MADVNTTTGPLDAGQIGFTLMHAHLVFGYPAVRWAGPDAFRA